MRQFDATATRTGLPFAALIPALRRAFAEGCEVPLRHTHRIAHPQGHDGTVLLMPAWRTGRRIGIKTVSIFPGNGALGKPGLHAVYTLFDATTGEPLAQLDGNEITARRTAAASALAASYLAAPDASRLLIVGAGRVARLMAEALRCVRPIEAITVWNRHPDRAAALVQLLTDQGLQARLVTDLDAAVRQADIVSCATLSTSALVRGADLPPGSHLDLIGSFTPQMREADGACFACSRVFVDTDEALTKSGDLLAASSEGQFDARLLQATLTQLCRAEHAGRGSAAEITLFKSVGTALEDLAAAELVFDSAAGTAT